MAKARRSRKPRTTEVKGNRISIYIPTDEQDWANQLFDYVYSRNINVSHLTRMLWRAWELNEEDRGIKKKKGVLP
jgi:hypothetical protein